MYSWRHVNLLFVSMIGALHASANNALYIATSNDIAKRVQLEVVANNVANGNTIGYEQDSVVFKPIEHKESKSKTDAFVKPEGNYKTGGMGPLKVTGRSLDMAIAGPGYLQVITPRGPRYTLDGSALIDAQYRLVNHDGFPFASQTGQPIVLPENYTAIVITPDGTLYADEQQIDIIGIFDFPAGTEIAREGSSLYYANAVPFILDEEISRLEMGSLRASNVNSARALTDMIELQRSSETSQKLVTDIANLERRSITSIMKP